MPGPNAWPAWKQTRHRGLARVGWMFVFYAAAYDLVRLPKLLATG